MFIRKRRSVPELNTASLPDLIFTVLFFFIIVTHMRQDEVKVRYRVPEGRQLTKMKSGVTHVYIGKPVDGRQEGYRIQVDSKVVAIDQLVDYLAESRSGMSPDEAQEMTVALSADKDVDMKTVMEVKQALRRANALKVTFIGTRMNKD
ncbi:biopolymer transporter ExbD [Prevotella pectinovora]|uniref:ExbD/TolR family protein n=1 Tax=Prevotella pectinovora TaxID=1602169 RepID=UPI0025925535|nr:biopolymer transporter ExbD [uncultured Prevotella sp.]